MSLTIPVPAAELTRGRQIVRMHGRVETVASAQTLGPREAREVLGDGLLTGQMVRIRTVAGNEWYSRPGQVHDVLPLRYLGIVEGGLSHATKPDPKQLVSGFAQAACNGKLWISVEHTQNSEPVLAVLGAPLFGEGDNAHVMIGDSPDCNRCRHIMGE